MCPLGNGLDTGCKQKKFSFNSPEGLRSAKEAGLAIKK